MAAAALVNVAALAACGIACVAAGRIAQRARLPQVLKTLTATCSTQQSSHKFAW